MTTRYLWTLEQVGKESKGGFDTLDDLTDIIASENLPGVMPADWIVAALQMDEDNGGASVHESASGWKLTTKRAAAVDI